jgi:hypothetical protein
LQQITDTLSNKGIHMEPGFWVTVPTTSDPSEEATVARVTARVS